jgi:predicted amidohydrolase YtcJ
VSPEAAPTLAELYARVAEHAAGLPPGEWVQGGGYLDSVLGSHPTREGLDAAAGGRPLFLYHSSYHGGVLNSEGIRRISGDPNVIPEVEAGFVERDAAGNPTGFIAERTVELVGALLLPMPLERFVQAIALGSQAALAEGLTSVTEPGISGQLTGNGPSDFAAYQLALERGLLGVRTCVMPELSTLHHIDKNEPDHPGFGLDLGIRSGLGNDYLRLGPVKIFSDGALSSHTAALNCPYHQESGNGILHHEVDQFFQQVLDAHRAGWQLATHAIGDRAVNLVLDAYEAALTAYPRADARHRIEHCGMADDAAIARIAALGLVPVPQGPFLPIFGDAYLTAVGPEREALLYRQLSFLQAGIEVPGSSDCPVVPGAPLFGIEALVRRLIPGGAVLGEAERLTVAQALRAYTFGSAYAEHAESRKGTLARGKLADFVVLSDDLLASAPEQISDITVRATIVGGEVRFGADNLSFA